MTIVKQNLGVAPFCNTEESQHDTINPCLTTNCPSRVCRKVCVQFHDFGCYWIKTIMESYWLLILFDLIPIYNKE